MPQSRASEPFTKHSPATPVYKQPKGDRVLNYGLGLDTWESRKFLALGEGEGEGRRERESPE